MPSPRFVVIAALCLASQSAAAQNSRWIRVSGDDSVEVYMDTQSIRRTGSTVKAWLKWRFASPQETASVSPKKTYSSSKVLGIYRCGDRTAATIQYIRYSQSDASGEVVESFSIPEVVATLEEVAPETNGETILEYVCKAAGASKG